MKSDKERILVVDDEPRICTILQTLLKQNHYAVKVVHSGEEAMAIAAKFKPSVVLLDLFMPGMHGIEVLERLKNEIQIPCEVVIMTAHGKVRSAVEAIRKGAFDYLQKPFDNDELLAIIGRAVEMMSLSRRVRQLEARLQETWRANIVGMSEKMRAVFDLMQKYADTDGTVLVTGESGTGKELVVRAIHQASKRQKGPFIVVNCGAIPSSLIESEFFGYEAGTFTDAKKNRTGKLEAAHGGTLFLDEVGDLPLEAQVKLLRVLEQGEFTRLGSHEPIPVDVRVIVATNRDLATMVEEGTFRGDLYWRLNVLSLHICPLRDRKEDIHLLVHHFVEKFASSLGRNITHVAPEAMDLLTTYHWPGNVRELQNTIYSAVAIVEGQQIGVDDLTGIFTSKKGKAGASSGAMSHQTLAELTGEVVAKAEKEAILAALKQTHSNKEKAAKLLGVGRKTLYRKIEQYGL